MHDQLSAVAIYRRLAGLADDSPLPSDLRQALCDVADPQSAAWKEVVTEFARVLRSVQLIVDPEVFFLHGPLTSLGRTFCDDVEKVAAFSLPGMPELRIRIVGSELGEEAGALGAASLAMEEWNPVA
jgi:predicted NBD/HSP70 family sugar kinase